MSARRRAAAIAVGLVAVAGTIGGVHLAMSSTPFPCTYRHGGPDPRCTPGLIVNVDLGRLCASGYAASVRPPSAYTARIKRDVMARYGATRPARFYQLDHLVALELGGAPRDVRNLWPQPLADAHRKDLLENSLHRDICAGADGLRQAQATMRHWHAR